MFNKIVFILVLMALSVCSAFAQIDDTTLGKPESTTISGTPTVSITGTAVTAEAPLASASVLTGNSSTTAVLVTPLTGRKMIEIRVNVDGKELWVSPVATATVSGTDCFMVNASNSFRVNAGAEIPFSIIASEAFSQTVLQMK